MKTIEQMAQVAFEAHAKHTAGFATWRELSDNVRGGWVAAVRCVLAYVAVGSMADVCVAEHVDDGSVLSDMDMAWMLIRKTEVDNGIKGD